MVEAKCDKKDCTIRGGGTFRRILFAEIPHQSNTIIL